MATSTHVDIIVETHLIKLFTGCCTGTLKDQVVGTWAYVSVDTVRPDGTRQPMYGTNPQGLAVFDGSGHYILMASRADIAKFASANRTEGTPEENRAVVQGMIAHFGTYT
jgi:hypothetical protein